MSDTFTYSGHTFVRDTDLDCPADTLYLLNGELISRYTARDEDCTTLVQAMLDSGLLIVLTTQDPLVL